MSSELNQFDIAFIIDTTSSMSPFIDTAKKEMTSIIQKLADMNDIDIRVGIVEYRDHPPEDHSFASKAHAFTGSFDVVQKTIKKLSPQGGGDYPESVYDGINSACTELKWRTHSRRIAVLLGDAPPHGWKNGKCKCGLTGDSASAIAETHSVKIFAIPLVDTLDVKDSFNELAMLTGGGQFPAGPRGAIQAIQEILKSEFGDLELDKQVLELWDEKPADEIARTLDVNLERVYQSLGRLGSRKLLDLERVKH